MSVTRRLSAPLLAVAVLLAAATLVLGLPDLSAARDFMGGAYPTEGQSLAVVAVAVWTLILAMAVVVLTSTVRASVGRHRSQRGRWARPLMVAVCGALLLGGGVYRHAAPSYSLCCGSVQEAREHVR